MIAIIPSAHINVWEALIAIGNNLGVILSLPLVENASVNLANSVSICRGKKSILAISSFCSLAFRFVFVPVWTVATETSS